MGKEKQNNYQTTNKRKTRNIQRVSHMSLQVVEEHQMSEDELDTIAQIVARMIYQDMNQTNQSSMRDTKNK
jgi:hypothetical protein